MGALSYRVKARAWLESAEDKGKVVQQVSDLTQKLNELVALVQKQKEEIERLSSPAKKAA